MTNIDTFFSACKLGVLSTIKILVKDDIDVNSLNTDNQSPLMICITQNHLSCIKYLLKSGANINFSNNLGCTPLFLACQSGNIKIINYLIKGVQKLILKIIMEHPLYM